MNEQTRPGYRGLAWDHPRGKDPLVAAAANARETDDGVSIDWDAQPLEGFESTPIEESAQAYDLIVLDHPHLGDAVESGCLQPLDDLIGRDELARLSDAMVGPSTASYVLDDRLWALPLDAATQVSAARTDAIGRLPETWDEVADLASSRTVALSLAGPHALMTFSSLCVALGAEPASGTDGYVDRAIGEQALDLMTRIATRAPAGTEKMNPIAMTEAVASGAIDYVPLVYGYVTYSGKGVTFGDAPVATSGGRHGSTIGGAGLAVTTRTPVSPEFVDHLRWLVSDDAQTHFLPRHNAQPAARSAWEDDDLNKATADFYRATRTTIEESWLRPRYAGWVVFQTAASALVRSAVAGELAPTDALGEIDRLFEREETS